MSSSEAQWDAKHSLAAKDAAEAPTGILTELWPLLPAGAALDLACGSGRNAIFLAEHGRPVTAVDWSSAALGILEERALGLKIPVRRIRAMGEVKQATRLGIDVVQADLESTELEVNGYFLILCVRSEEHTSELQSLAYLVCRLLLEKKKAIISFSPACASELACLAPTTPRVTNPLRKSLQKASVSPSRTSRDRISRRQVSCPATAIT